MTSPDLAYLFSLTNEYRSIRYDLRNVQALLSELDNPHHAFESVLIAGTNGKGSVARFLSAMTPEAGLYTSPHLVRINERIRIGDQEISDQDLKIAFESIKSAIAGAKGLLYPPTYFEIVTAMAFTYFRDRVKFAVLEVGLGGRLDATNAVKQQVSVITSIGLDHQEFLGSTLEEIAVEKAGIIKGDEPVVIGPDADFSIIRERAGEQLVTTREIDRTPRVIGPGYFEIDIRTPVREYRRLRPRLAGRHQLENMIVAIRAAECLGWSVERIVDGINTAIWPGRLERFEGRPTFLLDGAHNVHAVRSLAAFLAEFCPGKVWLIFGAMKDKQIGDMLEILRPHASRTVFTKPQNSRASEPEYLRSFVPDSVAYDRVEDAMNYARASAPKESTVVVCGSLYLIGEARLVLQ